MTRRLIREEDSASDRPCLLISAFQLSAFQHFPQVPWSVVFSPIVLSFAVLSVQIAQFREDLLCNRARQTESCREKDQGGSPQ